MGYHNGINVSPVGRAGGLSLWWDDSVEVQSLFSSKHIIDVILRQMVYGTPYRENKAEFWEWMSSHFSPADIPWLCAGDFNEFLLDHEKPRYLETFMQTTNLWDLDFNGPAFTWHGLRHGHLVEERIDRALINGLWQELWPNSLVTHGTVMGSDHCPLIIQSDSESMRGRRAFKFEAFWAKENDCDQVVRSCWNRQDPSEILQKSWLVDELRAQEECYWMQRSRVRWLREGDANTNFFHNSTLQRRRRNQIIKIKDELGNWVEQPGSVRKLVEDHFIHTFTTGEARNWGTLLDCISPRVTEDMNLALLKPVSEDEVKTAIFKMGGLKAPGPDDFQGIFYQSFWEHVYGDVCALVRELMQGSSSPTSLNATYIVLIPKVPHPETVSQFRPISLYNIGIAHEMFHFLKGRTAKRKFEMGVKLDMQKAYDRVEWDFLDAPGNKFAPSRGLRQGDPLSPYLFIILGEVLSCMIQAAIDDKQLEGVRIGVSGPIISHLFFADDTLLFLRAGDRYCRNLLFILDRYCEASGQKVNLQKSSIYFGENVPSGVAANLGGILGVSVVDNPDTYLGVPAIWGRSKKRGLAYVKGRILGKLQGWKQSALSRAGREVLIKAVVQAIPAYPMCIFKFPSVVCHELDALVARFWWGGHGENRKIHWVSKEVLGLPKDMGGLGFRNFQEFKDALLAKQCWRLLTEPNSLWARVIKARYFPHCFFLEAKKGARASWAWSSLLAGRELLASGSHWQIMSGDDVRVWNDRWLPSLPSGHPLPLGSTSVTSSLRAIQDTIIGDSRWKDRLVWAANRNGKYSVKSGYRWLQIRSMEVRDHRMPVVRSISKSLWKCIWKLAVPPKIRHFLWVSLHLGLPTGKALFNIRLSSSPSCPICQSADETVEHVFLRCPWVAAVWFGGALNYRVNAAGIVSWVWWLQDVFSINWGSSADRQWFRAYVPVNPSKVIFTLSSAFGNFLLAVASVGSARPVSDSREEVAGSWYPPSSPFVKINVDASWSSSSRSGFAGVVVRQEGGSFRAAGRYPVMAPSSLVAESFAILRGCELGASLGFNSVIIESDSLQAISCLNGSVDNGSWEAFPILARALRLGSAFQHCRWSWVPRSANLAADVLASADFMEMCDFVWVDRPPSSLVHVLSNDGLPCPH
ncbi:unnamed protein product [Malus baccata var. baccata]